MKNYKIFISVTTLLILMLVSLGVQASGSLSVTTDVFTGLCSVTASFDNVENEPVSLEVISVGVDKSELKGTGSALLEALRKIEYFNQNDCDSSGVAHFNFYIKYSGEYLIRSHSTSNRGKAIEVKLDFVNIDEATQVWNSVVSAPEENLPRLIGIFGINDGLIVSMLEDEELMFAISGYEDIGSFTRENVDAFIAKIKKECEAITKLRELLSKIENVANSSQIKDIVTAPGNDDILGIADLMERYNALGNTKIVNSAVAGKTFTKEEFIEAFSNGIEDAEYAEYESSQNSNPSKAPSGGGGGGGSLGASMPASSVPVAMPSDAQNTHSFTDISGVEWAVEAITSLYNGGIINGKSSTLFAPNDNITREEFVKIANGIMGIEPVGGECAFADVDSASWYAPYVNAAVKAGLISGYSDLYFGVGDYISRQDVAVILNRIYKASSPSVAPVFADSGDISDYAAEAVANLSGMGIINGSDGKFMPKSNCTRAEAACMVYRMMLLMKEVN